MVYMQLVFVSFGANDSSVVLFTSSKRTWAPLSFQSSVRKGIKTVLRVSYLSVKV